DECLPPSADVRKLRRPPSSCDDARMNKTTNITCPKCGENIPLNEAISHSIEEELAAKLQKQFQADKQKLVTEATRKAEQSLSVEINDLREQVREQQSKLKLAERAELDLRKEKRELAEGREKLELELARKLETERQKIAAEARQHAVEAERLKLNEKE